MGYQQLTDQERFYIEQRLSEGDSIPSIAKTLGRHKTTLYRELKRNTDPSMGFYSYLRAKTLSKERARLTVRKRPKLSQMDSATKSVIEKAFEARMSPEQVSKFVNYEFGISISHQTLYRHIWRDRQKSGMLYLHLRRRGKKYKVRSDIAPAIQDKVHISSRTCIEALRQEAGHYEIDTIFGLEQKSFLLTLVDIATKYTIVMKLANKEANTVYLAIKTIMAETLLPFKSITSDNGSEFSMHKAIVEEEGIAWYFCDPYSSWQRGLNENTNGLIRDFYPKRTDFRDIGDKSILEVQNLLNNRPRKTLHFSTPTRAMTDQLSRQGVPI